MFLKSVVRAHSGPVHVFSSVKNLALLWLPQFLGDITLKPPLSVPQELWFICDNNQVKIEHYKNNIIIFISLSVK